MEQEWILRHAELEAQLAKSGRARQGLVDDLVRANTMIKDLKSDQRLSLEALGKYRADLQRIRGERDQYVQEVRRLRQDRDRYRDEAEGLTRELHQRSQSSRASGIDEETANGLRLEVHVQTERATEALQRVEHLERQRRDNHRTIDTLKQELEEVRRGHEVDRQDLRAAVRARDAYRQDYQRNKNTLSQTQQECDRLRQASASAEANLTICMRDRDRYPSDAEALQIQLEEAGATAFNLESDRDLAIQGRDAARRNYDDAARLNVTLQVAVHAAQVEDIQGAYRTLSGRYDELLESSGKVGAMIARIRGSDLAVENSTASAGSDVAYSQLGDLDPAPASTPDLGSARKRSAVDDTGPSPPLSKVARYLNLGGLTSPSSSQGAAILRGVSAEDMGSKVISIDDDPPAGPDDVDDVPAPT
ncbi:unnamed protein product [Phytophthora lilii]|uniref:Unnamed protein product n=1 Tax=Phytophthora lilii TaxID=2077276 RepID=A0A9W6UEI6_9STRA|nr:unnamed protein product [Phytophthora lilii]